MNQLSKKIIITMIMAAIFLAPVSAGIKINDQQQLAVKVEINEVKAQTPPAASSEADAGYFNCGINPLNTDNWTCVFSSLLYYAVFTPMSAFTWLAAKLLDFFVYYSTNSNSYSGDFVTKAWGAVRDIANIFFIIALLYVAIKTILGLNVTDNKKLISAVIIVALIINFSLFATKVIIDSSNILAKVFYNNITSVDENNKPLEAGAGGQKSISVGLVGNFNPQTIITSFAGHAGLFIFVTILSIILMGFMIYIFLSVALLFVTRVVALWLSMIFSPIAFISYTVPFEMPGFGHKEWWSDLLKNSFLAPIFIFFLYVIALFGTALKNIPYDVSSTDPNIGGYLDKAMKTIIPFVIIFILLQMAKKLAITYSGKMGEAVSKVGGAIGGAAVGGLIGGTAVLGRATIGRAGNAIANSEWAKKREAEGKFASTLIRSGAKSIGSGSFDARAIKVGGMGLSSTLGKPKEGGFTGGKKAQIEKRQKRAQELEVGEDETLKQSVNKAETDLQGLLNKVTKDFERIDKDLVSARQEKADTKTGSPEEAVAIAKIDALKKEKADLREGVTGPKVVGGPNDGKTIKEMEKDVIPDAKNKVVTENRNRKWSYAASEQTGWERTKGYVLSGGAYTKKTAREAGHKIRMESKLDSGEKH
jgi:hypothetical protein